MLPTNEHRDVRARKPLIPYGVAGVRKRERFFRLTIPYERLPVYLYFPVSFARTKECKRGWNAEVTGGSRLNQPASSENIVRGLYGLCVYRGGSREGGPDGVWCKEGVAFRCVWVLWSAYGDARLNSMLSSLTSAYLSPDIPSKHCSHGRGRVAFIAT